jgi:hypothetical protein
MGPQAESGAFAHARVRDAVVRWLQTARPEERRLYARYMAMVEREAAASGRGSGAGGGAPAPGWSELPEPSTPAEMEVAERRACHRTSAPAGGRSAGLGPGALGALGGDPRPESAAAASWLHTATAAARCGGGGGGAPAVCRPRTASAAAGADGVAGRSPPPALLRDAVLAAASAAAAEADAGGQGAPKLSATAALSARASAAAAAPPAPKGRALDVTTAAAAFGLRDLYPDLWANTLPICRPEAAPNKNNFVSDWWAAPAAPTAGAPAGAAAAVGGGARAGRARARRPLCALSRLEGNAADSQALARRRPPHPDRPPHPAAVRRGETLRKGAAESWAPFLASTYTAANAQVHKPVRPEIPWPAWGPACCATQRSSRCVAGGEGGAEPLAGGHSCARGSHEAAAQPSPPNSGALTGALARAPTDRRLPGAAAAGAGVVGRQAAHLLRRPARARRGQRRHVAARVSAGAREDRARGAAAPAQRGGAAREVRMAADASVVSAGSLAAGQPGPAWRGVACKAP